MDDQSDLYVHSRSLEDSSVVAPLTLCAHVDGQLGRWEGTTELGTLELLRLLRLKLSSELLRSYTVAQQQ